MTAPTARELLNQHSYENWPKACVALAARVKKVLARHYEGVSGVCQECFNQWPCPTVRALNGEK
jgi:hypothetical protein